jgi:hypothetical protein
MIGRPLSAIFVLFAATAVGAVLGIVSLPAAPSGQASFAKHASNLGVYVGLRRQREPQASDHWGGCNDARASGTFPIYRDEPGYREDMDGDGDGIACEPHQ